MVDATPLQRPAGRQAAYFQRCHKTPKWADEGQARGRQGDEAVCGQPNIPSARFMQQQQQQ